MKTLQRKEKICPNCGMQDTRLSRRKLFDYFLIAFLLWPYRCRVCGIRFWRFA
jgi:hypothetical protein